MRIHDVYFTFTADLYRYMKWTLQMNLHHLDSAHVCWCHPVELGHSFVTAFAVCDATVFLTSARQQPEVCFILHQRKRADGDSGFRRLAHLADQTCERPAVRTFYCD